MMEKLRRVCVLTSPIGEDGCLDFKLVDGPIEVECFHIHPSMVTFVGELPRLPGDVFEADLPAFKAFQGGV